MNKKKGVSPVIATTLLIAIVIVLALIIFLWAKYFITERAQKLGRDADQVCSEIQLDATFSSGELQLINIGNIPINSFEIKKTIGGDVEKASNETSLAIGETKTISVSGSGIESIDVIPLILGETKKERQIHKCKNSISVEMA